MSTLYLAYQDHKSRQWHTIGRLQHHANEYKFQYTNGVRAFSDFIPFSNFPEVHKTYVSQELPPLFANRIMTKKRKSYDEFLSWAGLEKGQETELDILERTGGEKATDGLEVFPCPVPRNGQYTVYFFVRGIRYRDQAVQDEICTMETGEHLTLVPEHDNEFDPDVVLLLHTSSGTAIGYVPHYFARDFCQLMQANGTNAKARVVKINPNAPTQLRAFCKMTSPWPPGFAPCSGEDFQPYRHL